MNTTSVIDPIEKIEVSPEIKSLIPAVRGECGTINASIVVCDKELLISPRFDIRHLNSIVVNEYDDAKLAEHLKDYLTVYPDENMKSISGLIKVNFLKSKDNKLFELIKDYLKTLMEQKRKERIETLKSNWASNILVKNKDFIRDCGGKLNYESLEEYLEKNSAPSSWGGISADFSRKVNDKTIRVTITEHTYGKKNDMVDICGYSCRGLEKTRPMKIENAISRINIALHEHVQYVEATEKCEKVVKSKNEMMLDIFKESGLCFKLFDDYSSKKEYALYKENSNFTLLVDVYIDISATDSLGYFTIPCIREEYNETNYLVKKRQFNIFELINFYKATEKFFAVQAPQ